MSETKTAKIEDITGVREWTGGQNGTVFYLSLLMDNGDKGSIGKKSKDALKIGDMLTYTLEENERGNKIKEIKENGFNGNGFNRGGYAKSTGSNASFSLSYSKDLAVAMLNNGKEITTDQILAVAGKFKNWLDANQ